MTDITSQEKSFVESESESDYESDSGNANYEGSEKEEEQESFIDVKVCFVNFKLCTGDKTK